MSPTGRARSAADRLLLERGPQYRERVLLEMMPLFLPGEAAREAARRRKHGEDSAHSSRHGDIYEVGRRQLASLVVHNALRYGVWVREGDMIRHRDWIATDADDAEPDVVVVAECGPVLVVPTVAELRGLSGLLRGSDWERAAIVAAHVEGREFGANQHQQGASSSTLLTPTEFAALGLAGLKSKDTVRRYWRAWMDQVGARPEPGQPVTLPTAPFPRITPKCAGEREPDIRQSNDPDEIAAWIRQYKPDIALDVAHRIIHAAKSTRRRRRSRGGQVIDIETRRSVS